MYIYTHKCMYTRHSLNLFLNDILLVRIHKHLYTHTFCVYNTYFHYPISGLGAGGHRCSPWSCGGERCGSWIHDESAYRWMIQENKMIKISYVIESKKSFFLHLFVAYICFFLSDSTCSVWFEVLRFNGGHGVFVSGRCWPSWLSQPWRVWQCFSSFQVGRGGGNLALPTSCHALPTACFT